MIRFYDWTPETPPAWLPDWRDPAAYPDPESRNGHNERHRWRWEFLRRNPLYRDDWIERASHPRGYWLEQYGLRDPVDPATAKAFFLNRRPFAINNGGDNVRKEITSGAGKHGLRST
jgi:hypothetical protein